MFALSDRGVYARNAARPARHRPWLVPREDSLHHLWLVPREDSLHEGARAILPRPSRPCFAALPESPISLEFVGRKLGMTQIFNDAGERIQVTVISACPCTVVQK